MTKLEETLEKINHFLIEKYRNRIIIKMNDSSMMDVNKIKFIIEKLNKNKRLYNYDGWIKMLSTKNDRSGKLQYIELRYSGSISLPIIASCASGDQHTVENKFRKLSEEYSVFIINENDFLDKGIKKKLSI